MNIFEGKVILRHKKLTQKNEKALTAAARAKEQLNGEEVPGDKRVITLGETLTKTFEDLTYALVVLSTRGSGDGKCLPRKDPPETPTN